MFHGLILFQATEESNVALAVRSHRTLELAGDNFYVITCGRSGWKDVSTNVSTTVRLALLSNGKKITEATYGRDYSLQAEMDANSGNDCYWDNFDLNFLFVTEVLPKKHI